MRYNNFEGVIHISGAKNNPHDKRHKELFSNKKSFLSLLKDCVKEPWVDKLDEDSLHKSTNSFILQDFAEKEADIVYEATINGTLVIFYILLELQSTVDYRMPYRLLLYVVEILRYYYNQADANERDNKDFKFPVVFPMVFFSGSGTWTVPLNIRDMFAGQEIFGKYVLDFEYMLVEAKGYGDESLKNFSSKLLGLVLMLEKAKNDVEFYSKIRDNLDNIEGFDSEERRILNLCIKIMDIAYGYNKGEEIKGLLDGNRIKEADSMLCDIIENAKHEKEQLIAIGEAIGVAKGEAIGETKGKLEDAKNMLIENFPLDIIIKITGLSKEQVEKIKL